MKKNITIILAAAFVAFTSAPAVAADNADTLKAIAIKCGDRDGAITLSNGRKIACSDNIRVDVAVADYGDLNHDYMIEANKHERMTSDGSRFNTRYCDLAARSMAYAMAVAYFYAPTYTTHAQYVSGAEAAAAREYHRITSAHARNQQECPLNGWTK